MTKEPPLYTRRVASLRDGPVEHVVRQLADRDEIRELVSIYAHRMARGLAVADLFTDDGAYVNQGTSNMPPREVRGRAALDAYFCDRGDWADHPLPMIHNHVIEVSGDEASGVCSMEVRLASDGESIVASGYYLDRYRFELGCWKFVERDYAAFHWVPLSQGWAKKA